MLAEESVERFRPQINGRQRTVTPLWRMSDGENTRQILSIVVQLRAGQQGRFMERLQKLKQEKLYLFPGTGDRNIAEDDASPGMIEIQLRWKQGDMPDEVAREKALEEFREMFADVLDWQTAQYQMKTVLPTFRCFREGFSEFASFVYTSQLHRSFHGARNTHLVRSGGKSQRRHVL